VILSDVTDDGSGTTISDTRTAAIGALLVIAAHIAITASPLGI